MDNKIPDLLKVTDNNGNLLAVVFNISSLSAKLVNDLMMFTPNDWGIQIGVARHGAGYRVKPHIHERPERKQGVGSEALIVLQGKIRVSLYDNDGHIVFTPDLTKNMGIVMRCGHAVEFLEDSTLLEIKEGPYPGPEKDKKWIIKDS